MSKERNREELALLEASLGSLTPAAGGLDRDRLMFMAGRASASTPRSRGRVAARIMPYISIVSFFAACVFGVLWAGGGSPRVVERIVYVPTSAAPSVAQDWLGARKAAYFLTDLNRTPLPVYEKQDHIEIAIPGSEREGIASVIVLKPLLQFLPEEIDAQPNT